MRFLQQIVNSTACCFKQLSKEEKRICAIFGAMIFFVFIGALLLFPYISARAETNLIIDGSQQFQTIDGFGVNANVLSWNDGELKPAIDMLADGMGSTLWRVVLDQENWEAVNDNSDPNSFDWDYYDYVYSSRKFRNLWETIGYLNKKGISSGIILSLMGRVPDWMGGGKIDTAVEDEWVEMVTSLVYYARNTMRLSFSMLDPLNEPDADGFEGPQVDQFQYARLLNKLSKKLDAVGLGDIKLVGPSTADIGTGVNSYMREMMRDSLTMSKVDHFGFHSYAPSAGQAYKAIKSSAYTDRDFYMTEVSTMGDLLSQVAQGASGIAIWDGYDSVYIHAILKRQGSSPPNDAGNGPAPLAYDTRTGKYSPRKNYYENAQFFKYVPSGSVRIAASQSNGKVVITAFYHRQSGRVTIVGRNSGSNSVSYAGKLVNLPRISTLQFYRTSEIDPDANFQKENDIEVIDGTFSFVALPSSIFTLTGLVASSLP
jgi:O-glycosyl hydrolase